MVKTLGTQEDCNRILKLRVIDWEKAEYYDFVRATPGARGRQKWIQIVLEAFEVYAAEVVIMEYVMICLGLLPN